MEEHIEDLKSRRAELQAVYDYLPRLGLDNYFPPVIDAMRADSTEAYLRADSDARMRNDLLRHSPSSIPGSRVFRENIKNDIDQLDKILARHATKDVNSTSTFSTNAPYLIAVWNEIARSPIPVTYIDKPLNAVCEKVVSNARAAWKGFSKSPGAKVDVIAENGRSWIRVNTIRNSRLLAEFREHDSYLTDSEDEEDGGGASYRTHELNNSLLQMGRVLIAAAESSPVDPKDNITVPSVTLRLTRLQLDPDSFRHLQSLGLRTVGQPQFLSAGSREYDPRISQTLEELMRIGVNVVLGEHEFAIPPPLSPPAVTDQQQHFLPSRDINLDLSVLIALISDITHAPLPISIDEIRTRFIPTAAERERSQRRRERQKQVQAQAAARRNSVPKGKKGQSSIEATVSANGVENRGNRGAEGSETGESVHCRALANQALREMNSGLLDEIASMLGDDPASSARFWVSSEVRARCLRIVAKIGGPDERRRAGALLASIGEESATLRDVDMEVSDMTQTRYGTIEEARAAYWANSRHRSDQVPGLIPLRVFPEETCVIENIDIESAPVAENRITNLTTRSGQPFWHALEAACRRLLASGTAPHPRAAVASAISGINTTNFSYKTVVNETDDGTDSGAGSDGEDEIARAPVTRANPRLTAHTVRTLARGAERRWTTLTANRAAVREVLRESRRIQVPSGADSILGSDKIATPCLLDEWSANDNASSSSTEASKMEVAAIWVVEPRSLAESMRGDYVPGP